MRNSKLAGFKLRPRDYGHQRLASQDKLRLLRIKSVYTIPALSLIRFTQQDMEHMLKLKK